MHACDQYTNYIFYADTFCKIKKSGKNPPIKNVLVRHCHYNYYYYYWSKKVF